MVQVSKVPLCRFFPVLMSRRGHGPLRAPYSHRYTDRQTDRQTDTHIHTHTHTHTHIHTYISLPQRRSRTSAPCTDTHHTLTHTHAHTHTHTHTHTAPSTPAPQPQRFLTPQVTCFPPIQDTDDVFASNPMFLHFSPAFVVLHVQ